jgi:hypothetical protein
MIALQRLGPLDRTAVGIIVAAAATLLLEFGWSHDLERPVTSADSLPATPPPPATSLSVGPLTDYAGVSERPLFAFDRKPFVAVEQTPAGPDVEFQLTAVIIAGDTQIALLRSNLTPAVQRIALKQVVDGWTLTEVHPENVVLRRSTETVTVELHSASNHGRGGQATRVNTLASGNLRP